MSEEKIVNEEIKADEVISDEELEGVAGGYAWEIRDDANRLRNLGYLPKNRDVSRNEVNDAMFKLGQDLGFELGTDLKDPRKNSYYINRENTSRDKVWDKIYSKISRRGRRY